MNTGSISRVKPAQLVQEVIPSAKDVAPLLEAEQAVVTCERSLAKLRVYYVTQEAEVLATLKAAQERRDMTLEIIAKRCVGDLPGEWGFDLEKKIFTVSRRD